MDFERQPPNRASPDALALARLPRPYHACAPGLSNGLRHADLLAPAYAAGDVVDAVHHRPGLLAALAGRRAGRHHHVSQDEARAHGECCLSRDQHPLSFLEHRSQDLRRERRTCIPGAPRHRHQHASYHPDGVQHAPLAGAGDGQRGVCRGLLFASGREPGHPNDALSRQPQAAGRNRWPLAGSTSAMVHARILRGAADRGWNRHNRSAHGHGAGLYIPLPGGCRGKPTCGARGRPPRQRATQYQGAGLDLAADVDEHSGSFSFLWPFPDKAQPATRQFPWRGNPQLIAGSGCYELPHSCLP